MTTIIRNKDGFVENTIKTIYNRGGYLIGIIASHDQSSVQTVTFYDGISSRGDKLLVLDIAPENTPFQMILPKDYCLRFENGLYVDAGSYCVVTVIVEGDY